MTHDHDRNEHWSENPADDFAWNAYAAGWDLAFRDYANLARTIRDDASVPFVEGYADGIDAARTTDHTV